jgi:transketolase
VPRAGRPRPEGVEHDTRHRQEPSRRTRRQSRCPLDGLCSEVSLCALALERLTALEMRSRVINMPSWELFDDRDAAYRDSLLPPDVTARVSVEQASVFGWANDVGAKGECIGMRSFGASAPLKDLQREFGFTVERVVDAAKAQ